MDWKQDDPLARCTGETRKSNAALWDYALMGSGRSLRELARIYREPSAEKPPTRHARTLFHWSTHCHWQARVSAWEAIKAVEDEALWDERRRQIRQGEWSQAQKLIARAERMLKFPLQIEKVEQVYKDGRPKQITVQPVRWSQRDVTQFLRVASELARLAAEMEQRRETIEVRMTEVELNAAIKQELIRLHRVEEESPRTGASTPGTEADTDAAD